MKRLDDNAPVLTLSSTEALCSTTEKLISMGGLVIETDYKHPSPNPGIICRIDPSVAKAKAIMVEGQIYLYGCMLWCVTQTIKMRQSPV